MVETHSGWGSSACRGNMNMQWNCPQLLHEAQASCVGGKPLRLLPGYLVPTWAAHHLQKLSQFPLKEILKVFGLRYLLPGISWACAVPCIYFLDEDDSSWQSPFRMPCIILSICRKWKEKTLLLIPLSSAWPSSMCRAQWPSWTWIWANSRRWWRTGEPGMLQSMGSQRIRHDLATEQQQHQFHHLFNVFFSWALQKIIEKSLLWWLNIVVAFFIPSSHSLTWHSFFLTGALHKQMFPWARSVFRSYSQEATANSEPFRIEKVFKLFFPVSLPLSVVIPSTIMLHSYWVLFSPSKVLSPSPWSPPT